MTPVYASYGVSKVRAIIGSQLMPEEPLPRAIARIRESVAAILRIQQIRPEKVKKGKARPASFRASIVGTAFCVADNRYLITAHHIFNNGEPRDTKDKFYIFTVPANGDNAYCFPVSGVPFASKELDMAIIEIGSPMAQGINIGALPITFRDQPDGQRVVTLGFPAPEITGLNVDAQGNFLGGAQMFLKSHANEGIVAAQYILGPGQQKLPVYELNVGWHHGESGGPIVTLEEPLAAFSLMQHYRNIKAPFGTVAGPHRGIALKVLQSELTNLGVPNV